MGAHKMSFKHGDLLEITLRTPEWSRPFIAEFGKLYQTPKNEYWVLQTDEHETTVILGDNVALARRIATVEDKEAKK